MNASQPADRLARALRARQGRPQLDLHPSTTYEVVTRQMVEDMARELAAVRQRVDSLFYVVVAAIIADVLVRLLA